MIRPATAADIDGLVALESAFPDGDRFDRRTWRRLLKGRTAAFVDAENHRLTGGAVVLFRRGSRVARLYSIVVAPKSRGTSTAPNLLKRAEVAAVAEGCDSMRLEVRASNSSAIRLYERNGYRVIARVESYYPDGEQALRMEKPLGAPSNGVT